MTITPFNYATDGTFTRASDAWAVVPDAGSSAQVAAGYLTNQRRVFLLDGGPWILVEDSRTNIVDEPLDWVGGTGWTGATGPDPGIGSPQNPLDPVPHVAGTADNVLFATGGPAATAACSAFFLGTGTVNLSVTNTAASPTPMVMDSSDWRRARHLALIPSDASAKNLHITGPDKHGWHAQVELGPSSASAFFPSSPILTGNFTRAVDKYIAGQFSVADLAATDGIRVRFRPQFASADVRNGDIFTVWAMPNGINRLAVQVTSVADGVARISGGLSTLLNHATVTFAADQEITVSIFESGLMRVDGATTGNGTYGSGVNAFVTSSLVDVTIGSYVPAGTPLQVGFFLVGPLQLVNQALLIGGEQLSLNSVRLTFDQPPTAFDQHGVDDALNLDYYVVTGTPGLPALQYVASETDTSVVVFFDQPIAQDAKVVISVSGFTSAPGSFTFFAFGPERNLLAGREVIAPRVDLANPQTEADSGDVASLGTLVVDETGDLVNDWGRAGLRKRLFRRLSTLREGFVHLRGYGLLPASKALLTQTDLRQLVTDARAQCLQEPGVVGVRARVSEIRPGLVNLRLDVTDDNGAFELEGQIDLTETT